MRGHNGRFVCHAEGKTVPPRRGTSPEGAEGVSHTGRIYGQNGSEKVKITLVHGKPLRPYGHLPYKAEEFISAHPLSDKLSFRNAQIYSVLSIIVKFPNWEQFPYLRLPFACGFKREAKEGGLCFKHRLQMNSSGSRRALKCWCSLAV